MSITNVKAFAGKDYITFDGETIKKEVKKFETGAGVSIRVKRGDTEISARAFASRSYEQERQELLKRRAAILKIRASL